MISAPFLLLSPSLFPTQSLLYIFHRCTALILYTAHFVYCILDKVILPQDLLLQLAHTKNIKKEKHENKIIQKVYKQGRRGLCFNVLQ